LINLVYNDIIINKGGDNMKYPKYKEQYFVPSILNGALYVPVTWIDDKYNFFHQENNLICDTPEEAIKMAKDILKYTQGR
jgi:hypothetical protein